MIYSDGTRCRHYADYQGICRWHWFADLFSGGKTRPRNKISVWRWYACCCFVGMSPVLLWKFLKSPSLSGFFLLISTFALCPIAVSFISCLTANCRAFWPKIHAVTFGLWGIIFVLAGLVYLFYPAVYVTIVKSHELTSLPPRILYSIGLFSFGLGGVLYSLVISLFSQRRLILGFCLGLLVIGLFGTFALSFSAKRPILTTILTVGIAIVSLLFVIKCAKRKS